MSADASNTTPRAPLPLPYPRFTRTMFVALLALLAVRPLISETFLRSLPAFLSAIDIPAGPTPLTTVLLDAALLVFAALVWAIYPPRRIGLGGAGLALLTAGVVVSSIAASNKRLAINAGADMVIIIAAGGALGLLARRLRAGHVLVCVLVAVGCANAAKCMFQTAYEFSDTIAAWEQQKQTLAAAGVDTSAPNLVDYERRLRAAEPFGYLSHPNVAAACMVLALVPALAWLIAAARRRPIDPARVAIGAALVALLAGGIALTGSLAGILTAAAGGAMLAALTLMPTAFSRRPRALLAIVCGGYLTLCGGIAAVGLVRGSLPGGSLAFRWEYWKGAAAVITDHPLTGVGRENFQTYYVRYKTPQATEEVRNPHDVWVGLLAELGPLGLIGGLLLAFAAVRSAVFATATAEVTRGGGWWVLASLLGVAVLQAWLSGTPFGVPGIAVLWVFQFLAVLLLAGWLATAAHVSLAGLALGGRLLAAGLLAALLANLVHNLVGFSIFTPAGLATLTLVAAAAEGLRPLGPREPPKQTGKLRPGRIANHVALILACLAGGTYGVFGVLPSAYGARVLRNHPAGAPAGGDLKPLPKSVAVDPYDPSIPATLARRMATIASNAAEPIRRRLAAIELAQLYADLAQTRDPDNSTRYRLLARVYEQMAALRQQARLPARQVAAAWSQAAESWEQAIERYPTAVRDRIAAAIVYRQLWQLRHDPTDARRAIAHIDAALRIDDQRQPGQSAKLSDTERARLSRLREELAGATAG